MDAAVALPGVRGMGMTKDALIAAVKRAEEVLADAKDAVISFECAPENNVFATTKEADGEIEERLTRYANAACKGSYRYGETIYRQDFVVDGVKYLARLEVEYDRHDKTYYYIYGTDFSYAEVDPKTQQ